MAIFRINCPPYCGYILHYKQFSGHLLVFKRDEVIWWAEELPMVEILSIQILEVRIYKTTVHSHYENTPM